MSGTYNPYQGKSHHRDGGFESPTSPHGDGRHSGKMMRVLWELLRRGNKPVTIPGGHCLPPAQAKQQLAAHAGEDSITWLGHACFLLRLDGVTILTDPFLSERASPLRFSGPRRLVPTPLAITDLPPIDVIVMSHNHYDHLDEPSLRQICQKERVHVIAPLGLAPLFRKLGFDRIVELDWYEGTKANGLHFVAVPGYHFSGRHLWDENKTLWAGFGIHAKTSRVFFAGDTGYGPEFRRVGRLTGPYDVALVPIGAYGPPEVFAAVHASPEEAVRMGEDVGARHLVGMHWGTIKLTLEPFLEPAQRFMACATQLPRTLFAIGETRPLRSLTAIDPGAVDG
jgi:N-acyl-phosphatidylethanolamine-hydrolysing phospholipase D